MAERIELFWDAASPYTYLASTQIEEVAADCGVEIAWRPFLLGAVFQATGNQAPANVPAKGKYLFQDISNWARFYGVPLTMPDSFPANSIHAGRAGLVAADEGRGDQFAKHAMAAHWGEGLDISDSDVLARVAADSGLDPNHVTTGIQQQTIKDRFKENTDEAVERGAFGAPTMFFGDTMFWGNDRLELLRAHIKGTL